MHFQCTALLKLFESFALQIFVNLLYFNNENRHLEDTYMTPETENLLKEECREAARDEGGNSFEEDCEVRLVLDETPCDGVRVMGGWVRSWRFVERREGCWVDDEDLARRFASSPALSPQ